MPEQGQKITLRLPPGLHQHLTRLAAEQRVSLNMLLVALLAGGSQWGARSLDE